MESYKS